MLGYDSTHRSVATFNSELSHFLSSSSIMATFSFLFYSALPGFHIAQSQGEILKTKKWKTKQSVDILKILETFLEIYF